MWLKTPESARSETNFRLTSLASAYSCDTLGLARERALIQLGIPSKLKTPS